MQSHIRQSHGHTNCISTAFRFHRLENYCSLWVFEKSQSSLVRHFCYRHLSLSSNFTALLISHYLTPVRYFTFWNLYSQQWFWAELQTANGLLLYKILRKPLITTLKPSSMSEEWLVKLTTWNKHVLYVSVSFLYVYCFFFPYWLVLQ